MEDESPIFKMIEEGTVTLDAFNCFIIETTMKSVRERVRRAIQPIDQNRLHDQAGHSRLQGPDVASRAIRRPGGGSLNNPKRTGRGKAALKRQAIKAGVHEEVKGKSNKREEAIAIIDRLVLDKSELCNVWYNDTNNKIIISKGDWAEKLDANILQAALEELLGAKNVEIDNELSSPGKEWESLISDIGITIKEVAQNQICPHCKKPLE